MTKKVLNVAAIKNELQGASLFFAGAKTQEFRQEHKEAPNVTTPVPEAIQDPLPSPPPNPPEPLQAAEKPGGQTEDTTIPRHHGTEVSRYHDTTVQRIRAAVKPFGKEAATHRYTPEEKQALAEVVFAYHSKGIRTSENEISRIGINFLIEDYQKNGESSLLEQVLKALNK